MGPWNALTRPALGPLRWMACPAVVTTSVCFSPRTMSCVWLRLVRVGVSTCFLMLRRQNKPSRSIPRRLCSLLPHTQREPSEPMIALHPEPALKLIGSHRTLPTSWGRNLKKNSNSMWKSKLIIIYLLFGRVSLESCVAPSVHRPLSAQRKHVIFAACDFFHFYVEQVVWWHVSK